MHEHQGWARTALAIGAALSITAVSIGAGGPAGAAPPPLRVAKARHGTSRVVVTLEDRFGGVGTVEYTEAFTSPGQQAIVGDFTGPGTTVGALDDIIWYTPGPGGDVLWRSNGDRTWKAIPISLAGTYIPIVGQFSDDSKEDVLWYAPGGVPDYLWDFTDAGSIRHVQYAIDGRYQPLVGHFSDDAGDDIVWYAPGTAPDSWWDFDGAGGLVNRYLDIDGSYTPIVGAFARQPNNYDHATDILWYAPGGAKDWLWNFKGNHGAIERTQLRIDGRYQPIRLEHGSIGASADLIIWYAPGPAQDSRWIFTNSVGGHRAELLTINGSYVPMPGAIFGEGVADVLWFSPGSGTDLLWARGVKGQPAIELDGDLRPVLGAFEYTSTIVLGQQRGDDIIDRHS